MKTSWRIDSAEIWRVIAARRHEAGDHEGYVQAHRNREILEAAHNIARCKPEDNFL